MAKSFNQKMKLLFIMDTLLKNSDFEHPVATQTLIDMLADNGISAERKSIYGDIETLTNYGLDIMRRTERPGGYYIASREFELPELKLLVDAVQSSRFLTAKKSTELIKKLEGLTSRYEASRLNRQVYVANRVKTMNESIYYLVDSIHEAIHKNRRIGFMYYKWTVTKETTPKRADKEYQCSPLALVWENDFYYLVAYDSAVEDIRHYRVDKMGEVEILETLRDKALDQKGFDLTDYLGKTFGMYGGEDMKIKLRVNEELVGVMIDRFGKEIPVIKDGDTFLTTVDVKVSTQFFGWLAGLGTNVQIISPDTVREQYKEHLKALLEEL
ncbi:putative DNA-binding transcriptional regulator YafY [Lachnospiraceae bacterium PF1-21]|uniref:WYL domain-containing protein n=1 Tax=Ohessyouella blattaphilus TaxID=2949333 RepID=A0ABT1EGR4_9FIRM|nr:WYL domain-containing protein [Ohessyouella blattaphilus]MCP1109897.1 WYL domain-containing protein [Ohessyouella blattaphilus]MCR8563291.1 WYL domain-containing protein [Ohessyouella blattaphilus]